MMKGTNCNPTPQSGVFPAERKFLIVFDLDGTVVDSCELHRRNYRRVFERMGYGYLTDEQVDRLNGPNADEICRMMGVAPERRAWYNALYDECAVGLVEEIGRMFPGMEETLRRLSEKAHLALLSNGSEAYCKANVRCFGLDRWIGRHAGFQQGVSKAERIRIWSLSLGFPPLIVVGDRAGDIATARAVGAAAVGVSYGMGSPDELKQADVVCASPADIVKACEALMTKTIPKA